MSASKSIKLMFGAGGVLTVLGLIGYFAAHSQGVGEYEVIGLWMIIIGAFVLLLGGVFLVIDKARVKKAESKYKNIEYSPIEDYAKELEKVRENFAADADPNKNRTIPRFAGGAPFCDYSVIKSGKVYYSAVVQANDALFKRGGQNDMQPAVVLYSQDEYFAAHPSDLVSITATVLASDPECLRNESQMFFNKKLVVSKKNPVDIDDTYTLYITCIMINKANLPMGRLEGWLLPIVADPTKSSSFVLDPKYWTNSLIGEFIAGNAKTDHVDENDTEEQSAENSDND